MRLFFLFLFVEILRLLTIANKMPLPALDYYYRTCLYLRELKTSGNPTPAYAQSFGVFQDVVNPLVSRVVASGEDRKGQQIYFSKNRIKFEQS